jgi:nitrate reductase NapAB chaperone NapD
VKLDRRQLLRGQFAAPQCHIASLVVQCLPEKLEETCSLIESLPATEVPARGEGGKFVVLLEMESEAELLGRITEIETMSGVISANLAFHQVDD